MDQHSRHVRMFPAYQSFDGSVSYVSQKNGVFYSFDEVYEPELDNLPPSVQRQIFYNRKAKQLGNKVPFILPLITKQ